MMHTNKRDEMVYRCPKGINEQIVRDISTQKNESDWMLTFRLAALAQFEQLPMPTWGADLSNLDPYDLYCYIKPTESVHHSWDTVPDSMKRTFEKLGIPQAEQRFLAGVGAQYESEMIYKQLKQQWKDQGVLFCDMSDAIKQVPDLFRRYFSTVVSPNDNKFAALNSAVWSGGSFLYVPKHVHIDMPLQAYFRMNSASMGQFERTLIIADEGSSVQYVEGCSAPVYRMNSLHSAVVEIIALPGAHIRYTTIQNWSTNVYNLVTKRAFAYEDATVEWVDGNFGSRVTMKYPCIVLHGERARGQIISIAIAGAGQLQDAGAKIIHTAPHTSSTIMSKSISKDGGVTTYRGLLRVQPGARHVKARVQCDALLLDEQSHTHSYPTMSIDEQEVDVGHEASVSKINDEQLFYLQARGMTVQMARALMVNGFIDLFVNELPMEYAIEINRLIEHEMEGSIG